MLLATTCENGVTSGRLPENSPGEGESTAGLSRLRKRQNLQVSDSVSEPLSARNEIAHSRNPLALLDSPEAEQVGLEIQLSRNLSQ